jgi:integrase/recombinase XerD
VSVTETTPPAPVVGIGRLILDFLAYLELERGLSRNTLEAYRSDLAQFGEFLDRQGLSALEAGHGDLAAFLFELAGAPPPKVDTRRPRVAETPWDRAAAGRGGGEDGGGNAVERPPVAAATLGRKVACLRSFYRHLRREEIVAHDPTAELRGPRKTQRLPRVLTREEVTRLLREPRGTEPRALRDRALLEVMYACGLRSLQEMLCHADLATTQVYTHLSAERLKDASERLKDAYFNAHPRASRESSKSLRQGRHARSGTD